MCIYFKTLLILFSDAGLSCGVLKDAERDNG